MDAEQTYQAAESALRRGDVAGAEDALSAEWPDLSMMPADGLHLLAVVRARQGRVDDAAKLLRAAIAVAPDGLRHQIELGHLLTGLGDHNGAAAAYAEGMRINMKWPGLVYDYARACYRCGNHREAELAAQEMLKTEKTAEAYDTLSCALRAQGKAEEALAAAEEGVKLAPENAALQHTRGAALLILGRPQEALDIFERLQARGVQAPVIWLSKGKALANLKRQSEAIAAYTEGARRWPTDKDLQQALAEARH